MSLFVAYLDRVVDGDTIDVHVELLPFIDGLLRARVRIADINAPEMHGGTEETRAKALAAKVWIDLRLRQAGYLIVVARSHDDFGRVIAEVVVEGKSIGPEMIAAGLAVPYVR